MSRDRSSSDIERAVVDRVTDGWAILLVGEEEQERRIREDDLPEGVKEGTIVEVRVEEGRVELLGVDEDVTAMKRDEVRERLTRLKETRSSGRFGNDPRPD